LEVLDKKTTARLNSGIKVASLKIKWIFLESGEYCDYF